MKLLDLSMARRKDHTHEELRKVALVAARKIVASNGLIGLTAREVAKSIGYSAGTLYNLFESFDDLIRHMNGQTLDELYDVMAAEHKERDVEKALNILARRYIDFSTDQANLWNALFDVRILKSDTLPAWYYEKVRRMMALVAEPLKPLFSPEESIELLRTVRVLWSGMHGICTLVEAEALDEEESSISLAGTLIQNYVAGLKVRKGM